jgi:hypothetical protein
MRGTLHSQRLRDGRAVAPVYHRTKAIRKRRDIKSNERTPISHFEGHERVGKCSDEACKRKQRSVRKREKWWGVAAGVARRHTARRTSSLKISRPIAYANHHALTTPSLYYCRRAMRFSPCRPWLHKSHVPTFAARLDSIAVSESRNVHGELQRRAVHGATSTASYHGVTSTTSCSVHGRSQQFPRMQCPWMTASSTDTCSTTRYDTDKLSMYNSNNLINVRYPA